ncbi:MAG: triose-phosphate isomerase [Acidobacteriota bacterium]
MKKFIIAANWKMNKNVAESLLFIKNLDTKIRNRSDNSKIDKIEILIFPPFTALHPIKGKSFFISTGSQNIFFEKNGAYTGEISPEMVKEIAEYTLIGHSERREIFGETDEEINKKIKIALSNGLKPLLCIGESLEERESGKTFKKIEEQLEKNLSGLTPEEIEEIIFAYEPIWAIGTGKTATPGQAQEVHAYIAKLINSKCSVEKKRMILYGGSVKPENSRELLSQNDISGALIGGASLNVDSFFDIIENSLELV